MPTGLAGAEAGGRRTFKADGVWETADLHEQEETCIPTV